MVASAHTHRLAMNPLLVHAALLLLVAGSAPTSVHAFPANVTSRLNIHMPFSLHKEEGYQHRTAHFGTNLFRSSPYGSMALNVHLAENAGDACDWPPFDASKSKNGSGTATTSRPASPFMMLADRGGCSFTTKARNAQMSGAAALLIADTVCLCSNAACVANQTSADDPPCQTTEPSLVDDGSGRDVSIPTLLLHKTDGDRLKETLTKKIPVLVDIQWHPPLYADSLDYSIWIDILNNNTKRMLKDLKPVALALGSRARFSPHLMLHNGSLTNCPGNTDSPDGCYGVCTNNGRYCYPSHCIPGSKVVTEILRRLCIWKHHGHDDGIGEAWWDYVTYFDEHCSNANDTFADEGCIESAYQQAGVSVADVDECMTDSSGGSGGGPLPGDNDAPNTLLDQELKDALEHGIIAAPTVYVNHEVLTWQAPSAKSTLEAICAGYVEGTLPELCARCSGSDDVAACATKEGPAPIPPSGGGGGSTAKKGHFWRNAFLTVAILGGAGFVYYKRFMDDGHRTVPDSYRSLRYAMLGDQDGS